MANEWQKEQEMLSKNNPMFSVFRRFEGYRISTIVFAEKPEEMEIWGRNSWAVHSDSLGVGKKFGREAWLIDFLVRGWALVSSEAANVI